MEIEKSAPIFAALGDPTRLVLLARLAAGPESITRLSVGAGITRQAITKHLHVLEGAGFVRGFRHGRERLWQLELRQMMEARRCLDRISRQWDAALDRLKASVERDEE